MGKKQKLPPMTAEAAAGIAAGIAKEPNPVIEDRKAEVDDAPSSAPGVIVDSDSRAAIEAGTDAETQARATGDTADRESLLTGRDTEAQQRLKEADAAAQGKARRGPTPSNPRAPR